MHSFSSYETDFVSPLFRFVKQTNVRRKKRRTRKTKYTKIKENSFQSDSHSIEIRRSVYLLHLSVGDNSFESITIITKREREKKRELKNRRKSRNVAARKPN